MGKLLWPSLEVERAPSTFRMPPKVPILIIKYEPATLTARRWLMDRFAEVRAHERLRRDKKIQCNVFGTYGYGECFFRTTADGTPVASTSSETQLLPANVQPILPAMSLMMMGKAFKFLGRGVFSNTATPTMTWFLRMGPTVNSLAGTSIGQSAAITTASGVTNVYWQMSYDMEVRTDMASGSGTTTLSGAGLVASAAGFASPGSYSLTQGASAATWTWTAQADVQNYINFGLTWSANSSSNTCTLKQFRAYSEN